MDEYPRKATSNNESCPWKGFRVEGKTLISAVDARSFLRRNGHGLRPPSGRRQRGRAQPFRRKGVLVVLPPRPPNPSPARFIQEDAQRGDSGAFLAAAVPVWGISLLKKVKCEARHSISRSRTEWPPSPGKESPEKFYLPGRGGAAGFSSPGKARTSLDVSLVNQTRNGYP